MSTMSLKLMFVKMNAKGIMRFMVHTVFYLKGKLHFLVAQKLVSFTPP
jgi:hypothetical protein